MKINPNELSQNKYRAVKCSDISDKKQSYTSSLFKEDLKNNKLNVSKLRVQKKVEPKLETIVEPKMAELGYISEFGQTLRDIFKR